MLQKIPGASNVINYNYSYGAFLIRIRHRYYRRKNLPENCVLNSGYTVFPRAQRRCHFPFSLTPALRQPRSALAADGASATLLGWRLIAGAGKVLGET